MKVIIISSHLKIIPMEQLKLFYLNFESEKIIIYINYERYILFPMENSMSVDNLKKVWEEMIEIKQVKKVKRDELIETYFYLANCIGYRGEKYYMNILIDFFLEEKRVFPIITLDETVHWYKVVKMKK